MSLSTNEKIEILHEAINAIVFQIEQIPEDLKAGISWPAGTLENCEARLDELSDKLASIDPAYKASLEA